MEIYNYICNFDDGVTEEQLSGHFISHDIIQLSSEISKFINQGKVQLVMNTDGVGRYKKKTNLENEDETRVYEIIKESGTKGIWLKAIKDKTNMPQSLLTKVLKIMEHKLVIKTIKSVKNNRKVYVLYDCSPSDDLTGGIWYSNGTMDNEFVDELIKVIYMYTKKASLHENKRYLTQIQQLPTSETILKFLNDSNIISINLTISDLKVLLGIMIADDLIHEVNYKGCTYYRKLTSSVLED